MGGGSSKITETDIRNEINLEIKNSNENITRIFNETINKSITDVTSQVTNDIIQQTSGVNDMRLGNITAGKKAKINIIQKADVNAVNLAVMKIVTDTSATNKLATQLQEEISNKIKNDNELQASLQAANQISQIEKDGGGVESLVRSAMDAVKSLGNSLTGTETKEEAKTKIVNQMGIKVDNRNYNENDIRKKVENSVTNILKNLTANKCKMSTSATNVLSALNVVAEEKGEIMIEQANSVKALNKCVIDTMNVAQLVLDISNVGLSESKTDTSNSNKASGSMDTKNTITQEKSYESKLNFDFISDIFKNIKNIVLYIVIGLILILIVYFAIKMINKPSVNNGFNYSQMPMSQMGMQMPMSQMGMPMQMQMPMGQMGMPMQMPMGQMGRMPMGNGFRFLSKLK
jgi:hypothetical protein